MKDRYDNFISLGYFCNVAKDLEQLGLRDVSSPFDWCISDFRGVVAAIENNFHDFMNIELLRQSVENRNHYWNPYYNIFFFHDFSKYKSLEKQYYFVKEKYERRIERFYEKIQKPTLFIRYISSEIKEDDKSTELVWIEDNYEKILCVLQKYNTNNDIIFLGDEDTHSSIIKIYNVNRDDNDTVSRSPICNNSELFPIITEYSIMGQEENV